MLSDACNRFQVVFELTERNLLAHPQELMQKVEANAPDFVKLDMSLMRNSRERDRAITLP